MPRKWLLAGVGALVLVVAAVLVAPRFLPQDEVVLDQAVPEGFTPNETASGAPEIIVHKSGSWHDGDRAHKASGNIEVVTVDGAPFLRLTDFDMTAGPDVYLYLTPSADPQSTGDVEGDGVRVPVSTDADADARLNERGTFFVATTMSLEELLAYDGAAAWCDDFNVLFGNAALS